ncbi:hypothetical protein BBJ28_00006129 [Nothophytophthora sp. Chile5]|nr:hypothetical protein BBJ28_00006129 [Nothophytophthora sp. Chile5]
MAHPEATFSAAEAAVYDRQMRLWGVEAQKRLQNSRVLVSGLSALGSELVKNLVLAGMGVTLHDSRPVTPTAAATQFFLSEEDVGTNVRSCRAEASLIRVQDLNPLVAVQSETRPLQELPDEFFQQFSVVCLVGADQSAELRLDALCRSSGTAFFAARSFGFDGLMFADLGAHTFRRNPLGADAAPSDPVTVTYPTLAEAQQVQWSSLQSARKRAPQLPPVFVKNQLLLEFKSQKGLADLTEKHATEFIRFARAQFEKHGLDEDFLSVDELETLVRVADADLVPVCAIMAGILGQEIIKAISQKDEPICNYFCFDGVTGTSRSPLVVNMSTALAAARAKTKGKRMLRDALDAYGNEDTSLSKWNAKKKQAVKEGKWTWKEGVVSANAAIKSRFEKDEVQNALKTRFVDIQKAMEEEMSNTVHLDQHGGAMGSAEHHEDHNSEHPMEKSRAIEVPNEYAMCLHCYEVTAGSQRATLQKIPPRIGVTKIPGVCLTDVRKDLKRDVMLKRPSGGSSLGGEADRKLGPASVCAWQKEHSERNYVWRCTNRVLMHPVLRGSYLSYCGFHADRCIQEYGNKSRKEQTCPSIDRRNRFGMCRNHLEAHLSSISYEERGSVVLIDSEFDVPGIKECRKEVVEPVVVRHPLAPKYPPPPLAWSEASSVSMEATTTVAVLPGRLPRSPLDRAIKKALAIIEQTIRQLLDHPNPMSVFVKDSVWRLQFLRRAEVVAIRIQRIFRGNRARRRVRLLFYEQAALNRMKACRVLQRFVRGFLGRRRFGHEYQGVLQAVPHIQRLLRGALARKRFRELCAAIRLQRNYRLYRQRLLARAVREELEYMQALQRQADSNYLEMQEQMETFRRLRARRVLRAHILRWKNRQASHEEEVSYRLRSLLGTVKIQRQWRRYQRYKQIERRYKSAQRIQKRVRGWLTRHMWHGDPGVRFIASFVSARSGLEYGKTVVLPQPSKSYSYPSRRVRTHFGAMAIQRVFRGHLGRLTASTQWVGMLKRWEWLGIASTDSSGQISDSMTVGRQRYGLMLSSFAYNSDRRKHMWPIASDSIPDRGHAYKYQYILDLINDRDGKRGWSLAQERMHERQRREEQAWLEVEDARRNAREAEVAAAALRKHIVVSPEPLAKAMPVAKALFPVGTSVDVTAKVHGNEKGRLRRGKIVAIHKSEEPSGELSVCFDIDYEKALRNSYGRLAESGEQRVSAARIRHIPLTSSEQKPQKNVGKLIQTAIENLRSDIQASQATTSQPPDLETRGNRRGDHGALPTLDAIADRLRDCRQGFDLLQGERDFVDFVFRNSTLLKLKWLQVVSHIRYGTASRKKETVSVDAAPLLGAGSAMAAFYREFGFDNARSAQPPAVSAMPERAQEIEQRMAKLGFLHDPSANIHEEDISQESEADDHSKRPETTQVAQGNPKQRGDPGSVDDMTLFRGDQPSQNAQDLHRLIYELKEHGIQDDEEDSQSASRSPPRTMVESTASATRSSSGHGAIWLGVYAVCRNLEAKLGIAASALTSPAPCVLHENKPRKTCTACFLQQRRPVAPCRLYSAVAVRCARFGNPSLRIEAAVQTEGAEQSEESGYVIFRVEDDAFCPAVNVWDVHSLRSDSKQPLSKHKTKAQVAVPDPFATAVYLQISAICRDAVGEAWIFGHVLAHRSCVGSKEADDAGDEREVVCDGARGLVVAQLSQVVGAAAIHYCHKALFYRKYCSKDGGDDAVDVGATSFASAKGESSLVKTLFCRPSQPRSPG